LRAQVRRLREFLVRRERTLWWLHSVWALLFGVGVMWLGARHFGFLRVAIFHVAFIWVASVLVHRLVAHPEAESPWRTRLRVVLNYFNRSFYQQILFFLLPIYYLSTTFWSANAVFFVVMAVSAVLSTLDVVYDAHVATRRLVSGVFFGFNLFVTINVMLPILWSIEHVTALRVSALLAVVAFASIYHERRQQGLRESVVMSLLVAVLLAGLVEGGRRFIPPAPLRLASGVFGVGVEAGGERITGVLDAVPASGGRIYVMTGVVAPLGLADQVRHRWFRDGEMFYQSPDYLVRGGRQEGYRLWTYADPGPGVTRLRVDVETEGGQLIGRAVLR
jgi:hypothetical protein